MSKVTLFGPDNNPIVVEQDETEKRVAVLRRQQGMLGGLLMDGYMILAGMVPKDLRGRSTQQWLLAVTNVVGRPQLDRHVEAVKNGYKKIRAVEAEAKGQRVQQRGKGKLLPMPNAPLTDAGACVRCGGVGTYAIEVHHEECDGDVQSAFCARSCPVMREQVCGCKTVEPEGENVKEVENETEVGVEAGVETGEEGSGDH